MVSLIIRLEAVWAESEEQQLVREGQERFAARARTSCRLPTSEVSGTVTSASPPIKHVYAAFERKRAWKVDFYDSATQQRLCTVTFQDEEKLVELAKRGGALTNLETKQAIESAIGNGKGGVFLKLSPDQYEKLQRRK